MAMLEPTMISRRSRRTRREWRSALTKACAIDLRAKQRAVVHRDQCVGHTGMQAPIPSPRHYLWRPPMAKLRLNEGSFRRPPL